MNSDLFLFSLSLLVKLTFVFALILGIVLTLRRLEPRWRVLLCRMAFVGIPIVILGSLASPALSLGLFPDPKAPPSSSAVNLSSALFPAPQSAPLPKTALPNTASVQVQISEGIELPAKAIALPEFSWLLVLSIVWLGGMAISLMIELIHWFNIRKLVRDAAPVSPTLQNWWDETAQSFGLSSERIRILESQSASSSPFLFPGIRLRLIIPTNLQELLTEPEVKDVFRHEAAHAINRDSRWLTAARLLNCFLWFHPLLRWLSMEHLVACEEAADAAAARKGDASHYQQALAQAALKLMPVSAGVPSLIRRSRVINRLRRVQNNSTLKPPSRLAVFTALILLLTVCFISGNIGLAQVDEKQPAPLVPAETQPESSAPNTLSPEEQKQVSEADQLALRAKQLVELDLFKEALEKLVHSLNILPESPLTSERRDAYVKLINRINAELKQDSELASSDLPLDDEFDPKIVKTLIIPEVDFQSLPLDNALVQLAAISKKADPEGVGAPIYLMADGDAAKTQITLKLTNVPLTEAIRYTASLAGLEFQVNNKGVFVYDPSKKSQSLLFFTKTYPVSENFFPRGVAAKEFLEQLGIRFGDGDSAIYNSGRSSLIMRNLSAEHEKLERFLGVISSNTDPNDLWYQAFLHVKAADEAEKKGEMQNAWQNLSFALPIFQYLRFRHPDYQKEIIEARIDLCEERIIELQFGLSRDDLPKSGEPVASELWPEKGEGIILPSTPIPPELEDSVLKISGVTVDRSNDKKSAKLDVEIVSHYPQKVSAEKMNLQVKIFDLSNGHELAPGKGNITVKYPSAPYDWKNNQKEQILITYEISPDDPTAVKRDYYGYVIELFHDDVLQYVVASPSKLVRLTQ